MTTQLQRMDASRYHHIISLILDEREIGINEKKDHVIVWNTPCLLGEYISDEYFGWRRGTGCAGSVARV